MYLNKHKNSGDLIACRNPGKSLYPWQVCLSVQCTYSHGEIITILYSTDVLLHSSTYKYLKLYPLKMFYSATVQRGLFGKALPPLEKCQPVNNKK